MRWTRLILGGAAAAADRAALLLGGVFRDAPRRDADRGRPPPRRASAADGLLGRRNATVATVAKLQAALRASPDDVKALDPLGLAYQQRARETGDPTYYTKSEGVLDRALAPRAADLLATSGLGSLALSRHRFGEALVLGRRRTRSRRRPRGTTA